MFSFFRSKKWGKKDVDHIEKRRVLFIIEKDVVNTDKLLVLLIFEKIMVFFFNCKASCIVHI